MDYSLLCPVARQSETIGISGKRGCGKTMLAVLKIYEFYRMTFKVYSNVTLTMIPYTRINTLKDIEMIYNDDINVNKVLLLDDVDRVLHARNFAFNKELNDILMDFGKISCSIVYTSKMGPLSEGKSVDVALRDATDIWYLPEICLKYQHLDPRMTMFMEQFMWFKMMQIMYINGDLMSCGMLNPILDLVPLCKLYLTKEKVKPLIVREV